jgi:hypothetical protein
MVKEEKGENIVNQAFREPEPEPIIVVPVYNSNFEEKLTNMIKDY